MKALRVLSILLLTIATHRAYAWGDDGQQAIALIAQNYLKPAAKTKIDAMLKADPDNLTPHDLPSEATWADKFRDSNNRRDHYQQTQNWHFVDLEINDPDIAAACFGRPAAGRHAGIEWAAERLRGGQNQSVCSRAERPEYGP